MVSLSLFIFVCMMDYDNIAGIRSHLDTDCLLALCVLPVCLSQSHKYLDHVVSLGVLSSEPNRIFIITVVNKQRQT